MLRLITHVLMSQIMLSSFNEESLIVNTFNEVSNPLYKEV